MGSAREAQRRNGIKRPGPAERLDTELRRERDRIRQQECRRQRRLAATYRNRSREEQIPERPTLAPIRARCPVINQRHVRQDADAILSSVSLILDRSSDLQHQQLVLQTVWSDPRIAPSFPESARLSAQVKAQKEIIAGLVQSLSEVKNARRRADLVTKHAILTAAVSSVASASGRQKARLLGVHPRNVKAAIQRRSSMGSNLQIVWTLSIRKQRKDATSDSVRAAVIAWWVAETRPSPNRKEVVKHWVAPGVHENHHCQYLLESQVWLSSPQNPLCLQVYFIAWSSNRCRGLECSISIA
jgi:hypothetical protein